VRPEEFNVVVERIANETVYADVLKREYEQRRLNESYRYLGPRKPFFPPHLVVARGRR